AGWAAVAGHRRRSRPRRAAHHRPPGARALRGRLPARGGGRGAPPRVPAPGRPAVPPHRLRTARGPPRGGARGRAWRAPPRGPARGGARAGQPPAEVARAAADRAAGTVSFFALDTEEHLRAGGRLSADPGRPAGGGLLASRPLLRIADGVITILERVRTRAAA